MGAQWMRTRSGGGPGGGEDGAMRRALLMLAVALAALAALSSGARARSPSVSVIPDYGNQFQTFTFVGNGFTPEAVLDQFYYSPDWEEFRPYQGDSPAAVIVDPDGTFRVTVVPAVDFAGGRAGNWHAYFCLSGTADCWEVEFVIAW